MKMYTIDERFADAAALLSAIESRTVRREPHGLRLARGSARQKDAPRAHHRDDNHDLRRYRVGRNYPHSIRNDLHRWHRFLEFPVPGNHGRDRRALRRERQGRP